MHIGRVAESSSRPDGEPGYKRACMSLEGSANCLIPCVSLMASTFSWLEHALQDAGCFKWETLIGDPLVTNRVCSVTKERARIALHIMGYRADRNCSELLAVDPLSLWTTSPKEWPVKQLGLAKWGPFRNRGYIPEFGGGKLFSGSFAECDELIEAQSYTRDIIARLKGVPPHRLVRVPEGASLKPPGSPPGPPHLDRERAKDREDPELLDFQCLIACTPGEVIMYPGSHKHARNFTFTNKKDFQVIEKANMTRLKRHGVYKERIHVHTGDVVIWVGGTLTHESPEVLRAKDDARIATYSHWKVAR